LIAVNLRTADPLVVTMGYLVYRRSVDMAAEILGGHDEVARFLGTSLEAVRSWASGRAEPPLKCVMRLVELIEQKTVNAARTATASRFNR
jgi:hypothetical protein